MITIVCGTDIEYTKGDTFSLDITTSGGFDENSSLVFLMNRFEQ